VYVIKTVVDKKRKQYQRTTFIFPLMANIFWIVYFYWRCLTHTRGKLQRNLITINVIKMKCQSVNRQIEN